MNTQWVLIAVTTALFGLAAWLNSRRKQSEGFQDRFDPQYNRTAEDQRQPYGLRVARLDILPLSAPEAARSIRSWYGLQGRFINNPQNVVAQADQLVREVMSKCGYPMADFERRAAEISVDHAAVVHNYRAAQAIAVHAERGRANIEELRQAVVYYRALFDELLEVKEVSAQVLRESSAAAHS